MTDVVVIGADPSGVVAALRAAELGASTELIAPTEFGGMAGNDGPVPVRTLAHASRLMRDARQLGRYGISVSEAALDYARLLTRVREVVEDVRSHSSLRQQIDSLGVTILEQTGTARFVDAHTIETHGGLRLQADKVILCTGGVSRRLPIPGFDLTSTHSNVWALTSAPLSMLVVGGGATGVQVASIFNAFGTKVQLFETGPRILATEDADVATAAAMAFRECGIVVQENFGTIESFERTPNGVRMTSPRMATGKARRRPSWWWPWAGWRILRHSTSGQQASSLPRASSCRLTSICARRHRTSSPTAILRGA